MTRIYFVRHAQAEGNVYRICEGRYNGPLSPYGRTQLPCIAAYFQDIHLDAIYASDLSRAWDTAEAVAKARGLEVRPCKALREFDFGELEGVPWEEIYHNQGGPAFRDAFYRDCHSYTAPGGESIRHAVERIRSAATSLAARHPGGSIALVGHSTAFGAFFASLMEGGMFSSLTYMHNAAVSILDVEEDTFHIVRLNDQRHLKGIAPSSSKRSDIQFRYRIAQPREDAIFIRQCGKDAWLAVYGSVQHFSTERFWANAAEIMEENPENAWIPLVGDRSAGLLLLDSRQTDEPATGHISLIYLLPEFRGLGLGAQLMGKAVIEYRRRGMDTLRLNVATVNKPAQRFYQRLGFERTSSIRNLLTQQHVMKMGIGIPPLPED